MTDLQTELIKTIMITGADETSKTAMLVCLLEQVAMDMEVVVMSYDEMPPMRSYTYYNLKSLLKNPEKSAQEIYTFHGRDAVYAIDEIDSIATAKLLHRLIAKGTTVWFTMQNIGHDLNSSTFLLQNYFKQMNVKNYRYRADRVIMLTRVPGYKPEITTCAVAYK